MVGKPLTCMSRPAEPIGGLPHQPEWPANLPGLPREALPKTIAALWPVDRTWSTARLDLDAGANSAGYRTPARVSAVMMLFLPAESPSAAPARILFMRRSHRVRSHRGQISLPGGRAEAEDLTPWETALRELAEEVGLDAKRVHPLGGLPPLKALDGHGVWPMVGVTSALPHELVAQPDEVESLFAEPWPTFAEDSSGDRLQRGRGESFAFNLFGHWHQSTYYPSAGGKIWGLTAKILKCAALA